MTSLSLVFQLLQAWFDIKLQQKASFQNYFYLGIGMTDRNID